MRGYGVRALLRRPQRDPQELSVELQREMEGEGMTARDGEVEGMSQQEVLAIVRRSNVPLTSTEIANIGWPDDNPGRVNSTRNALHKLESWGLVRRVGTKTSEKGNKNILWEAVE